MAEEKVVPGTGGDHYIPYSERSGGESVVSCEILGLNHGITV